MGVLFGSWGEAKELILRSEMFFQKEQCGRIFLISHKMGITEMFERVVEL
ncbi:MAG: hypothetical protein WC665_06755 [Sulfurimonas sp.]|jgi:hypothetical protein